MSVAIPNLDHWSVRKWVDHSRLVEYRMVASGEAWMRSLMGGNSLPWGRCLQRGPPLSAPNFMIMAREAGTPIGPEEAERMARQAAEERRRLH